MRTITSSDGTEETITARRAESADAQAISRLIRPSTEAVFGRVNVLYLLEKTNLAVTLVNAQREVVAHAAFIDYPNLGTADQADWESWLHNSYSSETCSPLNTLFMHLFVAHPDFSIGSANEIIRTVFSAVTELQFIYLFVPTSASLEPALSAIFKQVEGLQESTTDSPFTAFVCERHDHCPALHIRKARVEDHDDLTPIFAQHTNKLQSTYGDYFLAELIEAQDEDNHAAVCESEGTAVGFMSLSGDVNVHLLNECFELGLFHGLCKPHPEDILEPPSEPHGEPETDTSRHPSHRPESVLSQQSHTNSEQDPLEVQRELTELCSAETAEGDISPAARNIEKITTDTFAAIYKGTLNAFCVQLFVIEGKYEIRSVDFLPYIFKLYPERDFCIITVPKLTPEFPLLQSFVRVIPRHTSTFGQELYVYHRSGLFKCFNVRMAKSSDRMGIESLVQNLRLRQSILEGVDLFCRARRDRDGTPLQAFVAEVLDQIVGILIIKNEEDIDYIRSHYNIENFIYFSHHRQDEHAQLLHFALNPVFQHYAKHFFKEALRLSYKSCLYYPVYPPQGEVKDAYAHPLTSALNCMVPVRPRRQIVYPLEELGTNAPSRRVSEDQAPYALNHLNRKLTLEPKVTINARIVLVGSSDTGMAFLEVLAFCPHLRFNNITLISTHGFPDGCSKDLVKTNFLATSHCYSERDHAMLSLRSWVNVVEGKMKGIDRAAKHVLVSEGRKVLYDHLVLCTGQQYQVPCPTGADISQLCTNRELAVRPDQRYTGPTPSNLFTVNDQRDCLKLHNWLQQNFLHLEGNAVVYGNTIDVFTTTETMLSLGVSGSRIHLVQPPLDTAVTCFNNPAVERAVDGALRDAGVTVHHNGLLAQWNDGKDSEPITSVSFTTDTTPVKLQCSVFISFYKKGVDSDAFKAVNDACLVYDGKLVIDTAFHTNDPVVRAAGPLTKFARRYHADEWSHQVFSSREVGVQLAEALLPFFDPTLETAADLPVELDRLVPKYTGAKTRGAKLPGGYYYLHAAKPGPDTPLQAQMSHAKYGREIVTGSASTGDYFRLHLNQHGEVQTITCLSRTPFPASNYLCLYGESEQLLNRLCERCDEGLVSDLYSYFREPWCLAIYHDRFMDFKREVHQIMASRQVPDSPSLAEIIQQIVDGELVLTGDPKQHLRAISEQHGLRTPVERSALNYLKYNRQQLPMFALPGLI
ncbi:cilia- and flagella-associated protein 61 isoform X2 [Amia ocellicauda]|uniref:cilia- and flagella-associated protein 61 isoform X2 n=1 Tax=Amia ocellicauda TaxID=2972642 RepID=UPI00346452E5